LASGEHVTGGLVAAAAYWPPTAGSVDRAAGCINILRIVF